MTQFPERLKQLRGKMPRTTLSELCGLPRNSISAYESGEKTPSVDSITRIADYFSCSVDWLLGRQNFLHK